jgi:hypothetical protein
MGGKMAGSSVVGSSRGSVALLALALASGCLRSGAGPNGGGRGPTAALFVPAQASMGQPFYARRVAEQANADAYAETAERVAFRLESRAIDYSAIGNDTPLAPRSARALPMGVVNETLAVLTSRCLVDYRYPLRQGTDPRFRNLALFDADGRSPRSVFMLAPVPQRDELSEARDPRGAHWFFKDRFYLDGPAGDRYFNLLAPGKMPRVEAQLVDGKWTTNEGVDLLMLYFPLADPDVAALRPEDSLLMEDPMSVVRAAMAGRTDYMGFKFDMITQDCHHGAEADVQHLDHEVALWRGIATAAAAAAVLPLLGPALAGEGGFAGFAAKLATDAKQTIGPRIFAGFKSAVWRVAQRALTGEQLGDVLWDEGGHLAISTVIGGTPRRLLVAGVRRGSADNEIAARVLATVREFVRDRAGKLLTQSVPGHADVASLIRDDVGVDLSTELLARGLGALDTEDPSTLARQPTLIRAAAFALQGNRGPAVQDPRYQAAVQQLVSLAGL